MAETSGGWGIFLVIIALLLCGAAFVGGVRFAQRRRTDWPQEAGESGSGRLQVLETTPVGNGRRLVLVRRDDLEHLIMVGGQGDVVIETAPRMPSMARSGARESIRSISEDSAPLINSAGPGTAVSAAAGPEILPPIDPPDAAGPAAEPLEPAAAPNAAVAEPLSAGPVEPASPRRGANGSAVVHAEGSATPAAPAPVPNTARPAARRGFFAGAFSGQRDKGNNSREQNGGGEPVGTAQPETDDAAERAAGVPAEVRARSGEPARLPLAAVPTVTIEGPRPNGPSLPGGRLASLPANQGGRTANVEALAPRREDAPRGRETVQPRPHRPEPSVDHRGPVMPMPHAEPRPDAARANAAPGRPTGAPDGARPHGLPVAGTPWEGGGLEDEIERALRNDPPAPSLRGPGPIPAGPGFPPAKNVNDPGTTLGDLAEHLESALAREIAAAQQTPSQPTPGQPPPQQPAQQVSAHRPAAQQTGIQQFSVQSPVQAGVQMGPIQGEPVQGVASPQAAGPAAPSRPEHLDLNLDEFAFDAEAQERGERPEPPTAAGPEKAAAPAVNPATAAPQGRERLEEAPVISLDSRRREPIDPLEDEMARLLGELTGDTTRR